MLRVRLLPLDELRKPAASAGVYGLSHGLRHNIKRCNFRHCRVSTAAAAAAGTGDTLIGKDSCNANQPESKCMHLLRHLLTHMCVSGKQ